MTVRLIDLDWAAFDAGRPKTGRAPAAQPAAQPQRQAAQSGGVEAVPLNAADRATIKAVQRALGLPVTGRLDPATVKAINGYKGGAAGKAVAAGSGAAAAHQAPSAVKRQATRQANRATRKAAEQQLRAKVTQDKQRDRAMAARGRAQTAQVKGTQKDVAAQRAYRNRLAAQRLKAMRARP